MRKSIVVPVILGVCLLSDQVFSQAPTVASLQATGTGIKWYSLPTGGTALSATTLLVDGQHYYAIQTINGVESTTRLNVIANFVTPAVPAAATHTPSKTPNCMELDHCCQCLRLLMEHHKQLFNGH